MAESITSRLRARQAEWDAAEAKGGFSELPAGQDYSMVIEDAVCAPTKNGGHDQVTWTLKVSEGDHKNQKAWKRSSLKTGQNIEFFKGDLKALGIDPPVKFEDIGITVEGAIGLHVRVGVRQKDEFVNYDFKERLEGVAEAKTVSAEEGGTVEVDQEVSVTDGDVIAMGKNDDEEALQKVIDDNGLNIDQDDYKTYGEVALLIIEQLGL